jgi:hypothetical protein
MSCTIKIGELSEFFYDFKINQIAELHKEILTEKSDEYLKLEMSACLQNVLDISSRLLSESRYYSQNTGPVVLEWLDLLDQLLVASNCLIKTTFQNEKPDDVYIDRAKNYSEYAISQIIELCRMEMRKKRVTLRSRYSLAQEIRESTLLLLATAFYHIPKILFTTSSVLAKKEEPEKILSVASEAMGNLTNL